MARGAKQTTGQIQDRILGGFNAVLRSAEREKRNGKTCLNAVETAMANKTAKIKQADEDAPRFTRLSPHFYGKNYGEVDGKLTKMPTQEDSQ